MAVGNNVVFIGRLTRDPEIKVVGNDNKVCNFSLARNRSYNKDKDHPEADFIDCVAWNKTAELIGKYFHKGSRMGVAGELQTRTYDDNNGVKRKVVEIIVNSIEFLDPKANNDNGNNTTTNTSTGQAHPPAPVEEDDMNLPF